jgi:hypothetical protein
LEWASCISPLNQPYPLHDCVPGSSKIRRSGVD